MPRLTPIDYKKLAKVFEKKGFMHVRTIPKYKQVPEFIILKNLKTAGISRDEYLQLLQEI